MAFNRIEKNGLRGAVARTHRVALAKSPKNTQLQVFISKDVHTKLGSPAYLMASVGAGTDKGAILLSPSATAKNGYRVMQKRTGGNGAVKLGVNGTRAGVDWSFTTTDVRFDITDQGLVIWLPKRPVAGNGIHADNSAQASQWPSMQQPRYAALDNV
jgi:hypothetical protein